LLEGKKIWQDEDFHLAMLRCTIESNDAEGLIPSSVERRRILPKLGPSLIWHGFFS
jgi:hypothetical protein